MTDTEMLQYCKDNFPFAVTTESGWNDIKMVFKEGYNNGYELGESIANGAIESLQKENAELSKALEESENREKELCILAENLKAQIEKMKCCGNCKHFWSRENGEIGKCNNPTQKECTLGTMDKWELAE